ncbi:glucose-6-phosphate isomerase [Thermosulfidibacter takaii]|nr:glucose-6-phosphate isomerase [Thermosulfidibacter takaii]
MIRIEYGCALQGINLSSVQTKLLEAHNWLMQLRQKQEVSFMDLPCQDVEPILKLVEKKRERFDTLILIGIGGSSLGAECVIGALSLNSGNFFVLDNVDPYKVKSVLDAVDPDRTCINIISKSGGTTETLVNLLAVLDFFMKRMPSERLKDHIVVTTDPEKGLLRRWAEEEGLDSLPVPPNVGGRFSVLSSVGLFPIAFIGGNIDRLLEGARKALDACLRQGLEENPAWLIAALHYLHYENGKNIAVMMPYTERLGLFVSWWRQLWAESLGKNGKGQTPVKAIGTVDQHSQIQLYNDGPKDKIITFITVEDRGADIRLRNLLYYPEISHFDGKTVSQVLKASYEGTASALTKNGVPHLTLKLDKIDEFHLGALFMIYEMATALSGYLLGVNPFDQPGVEEGKKLTHGILGRSGYEDKAKEAMRILGKCSKSLIGLSL